MKTFSEGNYHDWWWWFVMMIRDDDSWRLMMEMMMMIKLIMVIDNVDHYVFLTISWWLLIVMIIDRDDYWSWWKPCMQPYLLFGPQFIYLYGHLHSQLLRTAGFLQSYALRAHSDLHEVWFAIFTTSLLRFKILFTDIEINCDVAATHLRFSSFLE